MYTYNPKQVKIALGSHSVSGYADDSYITIDPHGDGTAVKVGCDGEINRAISVDNCYTIKLALLQKTESNAYLQNMYDKDVSDGEGTFAITIKDIMGEEIFSSSTCWVSKPASWGRGKDTTNREWELVAADGTFEIG